MCPLYSFEAQKCHVLPNFSFFSFWLFKKILIRSQLRFQFVRHFNEETLRPSVNFLKFLCPLHNRGSKKRQTVTFFLIREQKKNYNSKMYDLRFKFLVIFVPAVRLWGPKISINNNEPFLYFDDWVLQCFVIFWEFLCPPPPLHKSFPYEYTAITFT